MPKPARPLIGQLLTITFAAAVVGNLILVGLMIIRLGHFEDTQKRAEEAGQELAKTRDQIATLQQDLKTIEEKKAVLAPLVEDWQKRVQEKASAEAALASAQEREQRISSDINQCSNRMQVLTAEVTALVGQKTTTQGELQKMQVDLDILTRSNADVRAILTQAAAAERRRAEAQDATESATARLKQVEADNQEWALNCGLAYIEKLARHASTDHRSAVANKPDPYQSPWEKVLADALETAGIAVVPQYPIAGRFLDLATTSPKKVDIEVDGESVHRTARGGRKDDDYWRDLQLQSLGWQVCRFWVYELREDLAACVRKVRKMLES